MPIKYEKKIVSENDINELIELQESWLIEIKGKELKPNKLTRTLSAFANTNGGDIYLGLSHKDDDKTKYYWDGFIDEEAMNNYITVIENTFSSYEDYSIETYTHYENKTCLLHITVHKTNRIVYASDKIAYVRHSVQNLPCDTDEKLLRLRLDKGLASFEDDKTQLSFDEIKNSVVLSDFLKDVAPTTMPYEWLRKQKIMDSNARITVAGVLLYDECPQATLPKQSAVKILRYHTDEKEGNRETLEKGFPITIEGDIYSLILQSVKSTKEIVEKTGIVGEKQTEEKKYPEITLHEIITNAILHRDYSIKKDIQIRIFTNRIEIESPGKLPGHITLDNILQEQCARNPKIVRLISKFPSPPNKDVGEGLNSAFKAMVQMQLQKPQITETDNSVIVIIRHERLADAETVVWDYLQSHDTISNSIGRELTGITDANKMKSVLKRLKKQGKIQIVEGTKGSATIWEKTDNYSEQPFNQLQFEDC